MSQLSIRELKRAAGLTPLRALLHAQLDGLAIKETRQGKEFLELSFSDGSDGMKLRVWSDHALFSRARELSIGSFLELDGQWQDLGSYGLEAAQWDFRELSDEERDVMLLGPPELRERQSADFAYLEEMAAKMADPRLRALCQRFLDVYGDRFRRTAAAREYHHARRGGLVEHVAQMARSANALADVYDFINRDLLLAGVLFHDCGKLWENCYIKNGFAMPHNEVAELMSHIPLGIELVNRLWSEIMAAEEAASFAELQPSNNQVRLHLLHLIASHHGTLEFGSPVMPKTPEAVLLHFVDNIDAKLEMIREAYAKSPQLAPTVYERKRPLWHNVVAPLPAFSLPADLPLPDSPKAGDYEVS